MAQTPPCQWRTNDPQSTEVRQAGQIIRVVNCGKIQLSALIRQADATDFQKLGTNYAVPVTYVAVRIENGSDVPMEVKPDQFLLQRGDKNFKPKPAEALAEAVAKGEGQAGPMSFTMPAMTGPAVVVANQQQAEGERRTQERAKQQKIWEGQAALIRTTALKPATLSPGSNAMGVLFFAEQKKKDRFTLVWNGSGATIQIEAPAEPSNGK